MNNRGIRVLLQRFSLSLRMTGNGLRKWLRSINFYTVIFFTFLFWYLFTWNIKGLAGNSGYGITPYLLPHFFSDSVFEIYGLLMLVLLTCDAPFLDESRFYSISRSDRTAWAIGKMIYIVAVNVIFQVILFVSQVIVLLPYISFSDKWGDVLYTAAENPSSLSGYSGYGSISEEIVSKMMPMEALGKQMILCIMFGSVIGAMIFLMNGLIRKTAGSVIMAGGVLASNFLTQIDLLYGTDYAFIFFFKWMNLNEYLTGRYDFGENLLWLVGMFLVFAVISCICTAKSWIKTTE